MQLETIRGRVEPIGQTVILNGTENAVYSNAVITFELSGRTVCHRGEVVPFRAGDEAIVTGKTDHDGIFNAYAMRLPGRGVTIGRSSPLLVLFGSMFVAVGCLALVAMINMALSMDASDWPLPGALVFVLGIVFGIVFSAAGLGVIRHSRRVARARKILDNGALQIG